MKSSNLDMGKRRRTYVRLIGEIRHALATALSEEARARKLTRTKMADILGKDKSAITKALNGNTNMTLETLADLAFALDRPVRVSMPARTSAVASNQRVVKLTITGSPSATRDRESPARKVLGTAA